MSRNYGSERRRHRLFVTQNTEYHLRDRTCIAVRDVWSGQWISEHPAVGRKLFGALKPCPTGFEPLDAPEPNCLLWFENGDDDILTSRLSVVTRPGKAIVNRYPAEAAA